MRSRKWLPSRGPPRWSRPPHGKRGVEQHLEGWSHADDRNQARRDRGGHRTVETKPARLSSVWSQPTSIDDIASRKAAGSASEASWGVERRVSSVPRPIPACRSRATVMAIRAGHGPPNGEEATLRLASANEMTRRSRLGASTSVNCQSAQVSGTLGPRKPQKNVPPTRRSRSPVTGDGGDAQDDREARSTADADGRGAYRRGSPVFRGFAAHDRADPQGAGGRGSSGPLEARGRAATCAGHCPGADAGAHRGRGAAGGAAPAP